MMDDVYLEYLIKRKPSGKQVAAKVALIAGASVLTLILIYLTLVLGAIVGPAARQMVFTFGPLLILGAWYGVYLVNNMLNIEYEYILTNSSLDIDKVLAKKGRKSFVSFDFKDITICAPVDDNMHNADYKNVKPEKVYDAIGNPAMGNVYYVDYTENGSRVRVLFQPTSKMLRAGDARYRPRRDGKGRRAEYRAYGKRGYSVRKRA